MEPALQLTVPERNQPFRAKFWVPQGSRMLAQTHAKTVYLDARAKSEWRMDVKQVPTVYVSARHLVLMFHGSHQEYRRHRAHATFHQLAEVLLSSTVESSYVRRIWFVSGRAGLLTILTELITALDRLHFGSWSNFKLLHEWTLDVGGPYEHAYALSRQHWCGNRHGVHHLRDFSNLHVFARGRSSHPDDFHLKYGSVRGTLASVGLAQIAAKYTMCLPEVQGAIVLTLPRLDSNPSLHQLVPGKVFVLRTFPPNLNSRSFLREKNLGRHLSGFGPISVDFETSPSDSRLPSVPPVAMVECGGSTACESPSSTGDDASTRV
ncbi:hypothetical protein LXA43DRAFT_1070043 [Ganoderma leucocontextum]|nr:hypothetical protein LXA43DRAFT_1070043 [Ganoderma leucocontextum]